MSLFSKMCTWFFVNVHLPIEKEPNVEEWCNQNEDGYHLDKKALAARHELWLYITLNSPIKDRFEDWSASSLERIAVPQLLHLVSINVYVCPVTFAPKFKFMDHTFLVEKDNQIYSSMHPKLMEYVNKIADFEKQASRYAS